MLDILDSIWTFCQQVFSTLIYGFQVTAELFRSIIQAIGVFFEFTGLGIIPTWMQALSVLVLVVAVVKLIIGRQHE